MPDRLRGAAYGADRGVAEATLTSAPLPCEAEAPFAHTLGPKVPKAHFVMCVYYAWLLHVDHSFILSDLKKT